MGYDQQQWISDHFGSPKDQIWDPNLILGCLEWDDLSCMDTSPFCSTTCQVPWQQVFEQFFGAEAWGVAGESVAGFDGAPWKPTSTSYMFYVENLWEKPWKSKTNRLSEILGELLKFFLWTKSSPMATKKWWGGNWGKLAVFFCNVELLGYKSDPSLDYFWEPFSQNPTPANISFFLRLWDESPSLDHFTFSDCFTPKAFDAGYIVYDHVMKQRQASRVTQPGSWGTKDLGIHSSMAWGASWSTEFP